MNILKRHICLAVSALLSLMVWGQGDDSLRTVYEDKMFRTYAHTAADATLEIGNEVVDDFIAQFRGDPNELFQWAMKDLGQQGDDEKDAIILALKSTVFDPKTNIGYIETDIEVPGFRTFRDLKIDSRVTKERLADGTIHVNVDVYYSDFFMNKAYGDFYIMPLPDGRQRVAIEVNVQFGWFFRIFITRRRYESLVNFRVAGFVRNIADEMERRMND